ncbi:MAG: RNA-binding protein [Nanoarchaeota archaeon]|nr:RNA-binding protein [Nanoarchaeota archaeon]MBU0962560.1 RNA-binding protein [Nanoarchaeota archaeon]
MEIDLKCNSCKENIDQNKGSSVFKCPSCAKQKIIRCNRCKKTGIRYKCNSCGFIGPN